MRKMYKTQKGITLVALVITIIVLIILAAVSINAVMNDGLIENAKIAAGKYEKAQKEEKTELSKLMQEIENQKGNWVQNGETITNKNDSTKTFTVGQKVTSTAEGIPTGEWRVLRVNENNRLELIFSEQIELTLNNLINDVSNSTEFKNKVNEELTITMGFASESSFLRCAESSDFKLFEDKHVDNSNWFHYLANVNCSDHYVYDASGIPIIKFYSFIESYVPEFNVDRHEIQEMSMEIPDWMMNGEKLSFAALLTLSEADSLTLE